jgi:hypothetical protein
VTALAAKLPPVLLARMGALRPGDLGTKNNPEDFAGLAS